jgi:two-component system, NarL family, sensor histidine kinase UhpB
MQLDAVPVIAAGRKVGQVEIIGEPADEVAEIWQNLVAMAGVALVLNLAMIGILYVLFGRVLDPLNALAAGLSDLEQQNYGVRLPRPRARELARIAGQFNALARALETARMENRQLTRRLITAQDDERRRTALDLHDEVGPCLFGLNAYASSIASAASELPDQARHILLEGSREILAIIQHLQAINRSMLERLRPMALRHVPLAEIVAQLVQERAHQHQGTAFDFKAGTLSRSYGDSIDLTIYRCIQESLTNVARHAQAKRVTVELCDDAGPALLELTIRDDGRGIAPGTPRGFGIRGMRERVEGLGGNYRIASEAGRGTCVHISIPTGQPQRGATETAWADEALA